MTPDDERPERGPGGTGPPASWFSPGPPPGGCVDRLKYKEIEVSLPTSASAPSVEAIREWFRRTYGREPMEEEVKELQRDLRQPDREPKPDGK